MTVKQQQCLLAFLGYYTGAIDGIWGDRSRKATERFQRDFGLTPDGVFGVGTEERIRQAIGNYDDLVLDLTGGESATDTNVGNKSDKGINVPTSTGSFWDEIEYFTREEFRCQCGGKYCNGFHAEPDETMVRTVNEIRRRLGVPVSIVDAGGSGVRCPQHNAAVGGVANSLHMYGKAADLHSSKFPEEMARVAEEVMGNTGEIGIYSWGIHVGVNCKYSRFYGKNYIGGK